MRKFSFPISILSSPSFKKKKKRKDRKLNDIQQEEKKKIRCFFHFLKKKKIRKKYEKSLLRNHFLRKGKEKEDGMNSKKCYNFGEIKKKGN